ncbi:MAG: hypothetical protein K6C10_02265 [Prevotella sp.]|nr:hypothetical protein [Prevotella sp.]
MKKKFTLALLSLLLVPLGMMAQNVTVHPGNGSMMPALKSGNTDTFYGWSGFATWKHEQLSLTMTTGDSDNNLTGNNDGLTTSGQLAKPANDIFASADGKCLQIGKGNSIDTYLTFCLPKGYRFTGYTIIFHRISRPNGAPNSVNNYNGNISFGETDKTLTYTSTTNTTDDNITTYRGDIGQNNTTEYTIGRTSNTITDMENVLYFRLSNGRRSGRAFIQLDHVELYFTAEYNTPTLIPAATADGVSAVDISFTTSKIDYGELVLRDINGRTPDNWRYDEETGRISYDGTIRDMNANMTLYEDGAVTTVTDNGFDGTAGDMVAYHAGSISSAGDYFKLESSKHPQLTDDGEAIYYIESPIWATNSAVANAHKNPIGYRIVSAKFNYAAGTGTYLPATFKIQYVSEGNGPNEDGTYGLNTYSGTYNWNPAYHTVWRIDQDGYIYGYVTSDGSIRYLAVNGTNIIMTATKPSAANGTFEVTSSNQIRLKSNTDQYIGWQETVTGTYVDDNGETNNSVTRSAVIAADEAHRSTYNEVSAASESTHGEYVLKIYGPDGETVARTINVAESGGSVTVSGYNNDAIKIGIIGTGLINGEITMQALDPYVDRLDIVCQDREGNGGKLTQQFTATDFSVRGGAFTFYVPQGFPTPVEFSFENLYSHYGDETYYGNTSSTNHARYFFVKSPYAQTADNVYDRSESADYTDKIHTALKGNTNYKFNNASTVGSSGGYFEEYPFSTALYAAQNPAGTFEPLTFSSTEMSNGTTKTAYLFTCDETRYNIAPTTATQHVFYAFYKMTVDMKQKTYEPILTWEKLYDETFDNDRKTDSKWGLRLTTTETIDDHGSHSGYLTVSQILETIGEREGDNTVEGGPETTDQILFIDGSKLMSIVEDQTSTTSHPTSELKEILDKNALIYLPYGSKSSNDNFAFNTIEDYSKTPIFRGANNIVLTDKYAFYAPYDIQVGAENKAKYTRQVTWEKYGATTKQSLIIPFTLAVSGGVYSGSSSFKVTTLSNSPLKDDADKNYVTATFVPVEGTTTVANTPYLVDISSPDDGTFVVEQTGSLVKATTGKASDGFFYETPFTATYTGDGSEHSFKPMGSYSGKIFEDAEFRTSNVFFYYGSKDLFRSSAELASNYHELYAYPFRAFYGYSTSSQSKIAAFLFSYGSEETDGISDIAKRIDFAVQSGKGYIQITSGKDSDVRIFTLNGMQIAAEQMSAGDTRIVNLPSGAYIVNGKKIIVK